MNKPKRPRDINALAKAIVDEATGQDEAQKIEPLPPSPELTDAERGAMAKALGRRGGLKGGKARAAKLTGEQRSEIARKAAETRWKKS